MLLCKTVLAKDQALILLLQFKIKITPNISPKRIKLILR